MPLVKIQPIRSVFQQITQDLLKGDTVKVTPKQVDDVEDDQVLQREGDEEALEGLRQMAVHLVQNPNSQQAVEFSQALGAAKDSDPAYLVNFFQGVQEIQDGSHDLGKWLSTFLGMDSADLQNQFVSTSRAIVGLEGSDEDVVAIFRDYLGLVNSIVDHFGEDEVGEQLGSFFNRFDNLETVDQHRETIENFQTEMEWE